MNTERLFNIVHYIIYKGFNKMDSALNKINPAILLFRIPAIKKRLAKQGYTNPVEEVNKIFEDKETGFNLFWVAGITGGILILVFIGLANILFLIMKMDLFNLPTVIVVLIPTVLSYYLHHIFVFKENKYLLYFDEFEKKSKSWKIKWAWISLAYIIGSIAFFFWSLLSHNYLSQLFQG